MPIAAANAARRTDGAARANASCESGQALEKAQNGNGPGDWKKVGMDFGLAPLPLGFGSTVPVWGRAHIRLGVAPRGAHERAPIGSGEGPSGEQAILPRVVAKRKCDRDHRLSHDFLLRGPDCGRRAAMRGTKVATVDLGKASRRQYVANGPRARQSLLAPAYLG